MEWVPVCDPIWWTREKPFVVKSPTAIESNDESRVTRPVVVGAFMALEVDGLCEVAWPIFEEDRVRWKNEILPTSELYPISLTIALKCYEDRISALMKGDSQTTFYLFKSPDVYWLEDVENYQSWHSVGDRSFPQHTMVSVSSGTYHDFRGREVYSCSAFWLKKDFGQWQAGNIGCAGSSEVIWPEDCVERVKPDTASRVLEEVRNHLTMFAEAAHKARALLPMSRSQ